MDCGARVKVNPSAVSQLATAGQRTAGRDFFLKVLWARKAEEAIDLAGVRSRLTNQLLHERVPRV